MAIGTKPGGGGQNENYDTVTGKYTQTGQWAKASFDDKNELIAAMDDDVLEIYNSLDENQQKQFLEDFKKEMLIENSKYEEKLDFTKNDLKNLLENNGFDQELVDIYNSLDENDKDEFLNDLYNEIVGEQTQNTLETKFEGFDVNEYTQMYTECSKVLTKNGVTQHDLSAFYNEYRGAGSMSFEFNKALRMGFTKFFQKYPQFKNSHSLNENAIKDRAARMDKLTRNYEIPRDGMVYRYLDENYLVSTFEKFGVLDDFDIYTDSMYNYQTFDRKKYSVQQMFDALQPLIGCVVDGDGGFTSFSTVTDYTHMGKVHASPNTYKRIQIKFDMPKGTKCFISSYKGESEGVFPRETKYFIKDIQLEKDEQGLERVVLYYGVQQDF